MENLVEIDVLDAEVVSEFGWTSASVLEKLYTQLVNSYLKLVLDNDSFLEYADPFSCDELRRNNHNVIASAWNIPKKLVAITFESVCEEDGQRTNCFNLYVKAKDMNFVKRRFLDRLAKSDMSFTSRTRIGNSLTRLATHGLRRESLI